MIDLKNTKDLKDKFDDLLKDNSIKVTPDNLTFYSLILEDLRDHPSANKTSKEYKDMNGMVLGLYLQWSIATKFPIIYREALKFPRFICINDMTNPDVISDDFYHPKDLSIFEGVEEDLLREVQNYSVNKNNLENNFGTQPVKSSKIIKTPLFRYIDSKNVLDNVQNRKIKISGIKDIIEVTYNAIKEFQDVVSEAYTTDSYRDIVKDNSDIYRKICEPSFGFLWIPDAKDEMLYTNQPFEMVGKNHAMLVLNAFDNKYIIKTFDLESVFDSIKHETEKKYLEKNLEKIWRND